METGIRERALEALAETREVTQAMEQKRDAEQGRVLSQKLHGILGLDVHCESRCVEIDGVPFTLYGTDFETSLAVTADDVFQYVNGWADVGAAVAAIETASQTKPHPAPLLPSQFDKHLTESTNNACSAEAYCQEGENVKCADVALICSNLSVAAAMRALAVETHSYHDFVAYSQ